MSESKFDLWLTGNYDTIMKDRVSNDVIEGFIKKSIYPSLLTTHEGNISPQGEVLHGLHIGLSVDVNNNVHYADIYKIDDQGDRSSILRAENDRALKLVEAFVMDFNDAVVLTQDFKPLCMFDQKTKQRVFIGYLTFANLQDAVARKLDKISIGVP